MRHQNSSLITNIEIIGLRSPRLQPKRGSKSRMEARPINARQRLNGGETVRKGRCPLNPAPPGALAGAKARQSCSNGGETVRKGRCPLNPALPGAFRSQRPDPPSPLLPALLLPFYYSITARARGALPPLNPPPCRGLSPSQRPAGCSLLLSFYYGIAARARGALPPLNPPPRRGLSPRRGLIFFFCSSSSSNSIIALTQEQGGRCPP